MMEGNPSEWNMHANLMKSSSSGSEQEVSSDYLNSQTCPPSSPLPVQQLSCSTSSAHDDHGQNFALSWTTQLLGGLASEQDELCGLSLIQSTRTSMRSSIIECAQEDNINFYGCQQEHEARHTTTNNNNNNDDYNDNVLEFSTCERSFQIDSDHHNADHSNSEGRSTVTSGIPNKKSKLQSISSAPVKVGRKEKLGDRITALHQLVSPFGKTDTASVLLEATGYIRFLQAQIQTVGSCYLGNNDALVKNQLPDHEDAARDLKSKGLCLVPIWYTQHVASENGADYWVPLLDGGF